MIINGLKINYRIIGEGRPFLIFHGWGSCSEKWQKVGELLTQNGLKVIIPDLPGFGQSQKPSKPWNLDDYCNFIEEFIKFLNLNKFFLLGHSFGGALAVKYSLKFPEKINKLFLVGAACIRKKTIKVRLLRAISKFFNHPPLFIKKVFYRKSDYLSVEGVMKETYLKIIEEDLSDDLSQILVPTVLIWGEKDKITPVKQAFFINLKIQNFSLRSPYERCPEGTEISRRETKLKIIPKVSHSPHLESPKELSSLILKELSSLESL